MVRRKGASSPRIESHWETPEAIADDFACEVAFLFETITISTPEGAETISRLTAFVVKEANRAATGIDLTACEIDAAFSRIIAFRREEERRASTDKNSIEAQKAKQRKLAQIAEPFAAMIDYLVSTRVQRLYQSRAPEGKYVKLIQPYYINDRAWKRAGSNFNSRRARANIPRDFTVGNRKPPLERRFGQSGGNPQGRPPKPRGWAAIDAARCKPLKARTRSGTNVLVERRHHKVDSIFRKAMDGSPSARRQLFKLIEVLQCRILLNEPHKARRRKKLKFDTEQTQLARRGIDLCIRRSIEFFIEKYERNFGGIVDFEAGIGLTDKDKALMNQIEEQAQAEAARRPPEGDAPGMQSHDGSTSQAVRPYPTLPRARTRLGPSSSPRPHPATGNPKKHGSHSGPPEAFPKRSRTSDPQSRGPRKQKDRKP